MAVNEWARKEIELAIKKEKELDGTLPNEWSYGAACYESAYKAFQSLLEDGHSGYSIRFTKAILDRLLDGEVLSPIEETEFDDEGFQTTDHMSYHCIRMSSLYKRVYDDGTIKYSDNNRVECIEILADGYASSSQFKLVTNIVDEMFPIKFPYMPEDKPYKVIVTTFLYDPKNGDFDTVGVNSIITPDGDHIDVCRYFKESENGFFEEIDVNEYDVRKLNSLNK